MIFCPNETGLLDNWWMILNIFLQASGLSLNCGKTTLIGINVEEDALHTTACNLGCKVETLPFSYLGIPFGGTIERKSFGTR